MDNMYVMFFLKNGTKIKVIGNDIQRIDGWIVVFWEKHLTGAFNETELIGYYLDID